MNDRADITAEPTEELSLLKTRVDELEQAEEALRESEARYRSFFEQAAVGVAEIEHVTGRFLTANRRLCELLGRTAEEMRATTFQAITHPEDLHLHEDKSEQLLAGKIDHYTLEKRYLSRDGTAVWVNITVSHPQNTGMPCRYNIVVVEDITERKQAEEALREKTEELDRYFTMTLDLLCIADTDGYFRRLNRQWELTLGYDLAELEGRRFLDFVHPEDMESTLQAVSRLGHQEQVLNFTNRYRCKDGSYRWIEWRSFPSGKVIYAAARDITERKQAEEALVEQGNKMSSIFRAAPVGIGTVINRVLQEANDMLCQMTGYSREELVGQDALILYPTREDYDYVGKEKYRQIGEKNIGTVETRWRKKDGAVIDILLSSTPLVAADLSKGVTFTALEITELRGMEKKLHHAQKLESLGTLAGGIAHDFNNLLMGIQGYASLALLEMDPADPNYGKLKRIEEQVKSGADLTKQLLGFARGGRYEMVPTDMNHLLEKTSSLFCRTKKEITLQRKYGEDLRIVEADRGQMEQVFMNLYVNAWQAMPQGGEIYLETQNVILNDERTSPHGVKPGPYVKVSVTDTGMGMDKKTMERIFDPFFTTKALGRGTGLGLATVYGIVKGHRGLINVYSEPGHGTTFNLYLPASDREVMHAATATAAAAIARGTETILLVDDEKMVLEVSRDLLESLGYLVHAAGSGQEALAVYMEKKEKIDLVLLDMIMPGISGGETFDRLREINPGIRVLLSSGYSINGEAIKIMDRGCNGFLQKPFQLENLSRKVRELLDS